MEIEIGKIKLAEGKNPFLLPSILYQMRSPQNAYMYVNCSQCAKSVRIARAQCRFHFLINDSRN